MKSLNSFGWQIHDHLKEHRPKQFQELKAKGELFQFVKKLETEGDRKLTTLEHSGLRPDEAMEIVRDQIFLPSE